MTATLTYERLNHHTCSSFPYEQIQSIHGKSYYKIYQLKLRQLLTGSPLRREDHVKPAKQKHMKSQEYMNKPLNDENGKRATSVISITRRRTRDSTMYTITSTEVSASTTIAPPKSIVKTRQSSS
jgi:hypothetical protein